MTDSVINVKGLTKHYKKSHLGKTTITRGVKDLTFEVKKGEVFGLLGLNGSGKTTTIKLLLGLLFPTEGEVTIFNETVPNLAVQKRIGYLPEVPYFYRNLTPLDVLTLYASLSKLEADSIPKRIDD